MTRSHPKTPLVRESPDFAPIRKARGRGVLEVRGSPSNAAGGRKPGSQAQRGFWMASNLAAVLLTVFSACPLRAADLDPASLAILTRDEGRPEDALLQWEKASEQTNADGFIWNQRAWSLLALGRAREAKESFEKAIDRATTKQMQTEANIGLGLAAIIAGNPKAALSTLRQAALLGPHDLAASAQLTAEADIKLGDNREALEYFRKSLSLDPYNLESLRAFARLLDKTADKRAAWLAAHRALELDPTDEESRSLLARNASQVKGDFEAIAGVRRIAHPVLDANAAELDLPVSTLTVRIGLYGAPDGLPANMTSCFLMANSSFTITDGRLGALRESGNAYDTREIELRPEDKAIVVRDSARNILFTSTQAFVLTPASTHGSVLIQKTLIPISVGVDIGDRELRGSVEVIPNSLGFRLIELVPLELYLFGVVSVALPDSSPSEAYRAQAVVSRTAAVWAAAHPAPMQKDFDLLDDRSVQQTIGVSGEMRTGAQAVLATESLVLAEQGLVTAAAQHDDSGGWTQDAADAEHSTWPFSTPLSLEHFIHDASAEGLFSAAAPDPTAAASRWMRILDASTLRMRVEQRKKIGRLLNVFVTSRSKTGRVMTLEVVGLGGRVTYTGFSEIQKLLSPESLRSTLITIQPLYDGKNLSRLVVWGAGTGSGLGFSRAGALGQAELGRSWREIVKRYFPRDDVLDLRPKK